MCMPCAPFRILAPWATAFNAHSIDTHVPTLSISLPLLGALWEKMVLSLSFQGSGAHLFAHQLHPQSLEAPPFDNGIPMVARASTVPTQVVRGCPVHKNCENNHKIHIFSFLWSPCRQLKNTHLFPEADLFYFLYLDVFALLNNQALCSLRHRFGKQALLTLLLQ